MIKSTKEISSMFLQIGIPAKIKGYHYLREAINLVCSHPNIINHITKKLYPAIAHQFATSPCKVERAIRHAIDVLWSRGKIENINSMFGFSVCQKNDKLPNGEFIALMAEMILMIKT